MPKKNRSLAVKHFNIKKYWNKAHALLDNGTEPLSPSSDPYILYAGFHHSLQRSKDNNLVHVMRENRDVILVPLGDMHWGHERSCIEAFENDVLSYLALDSKKSAVYFILLGDYTENAASHSIGSPYETILNSTEQLDLAYNLLLPLALSGKIFIMLSGNHGRRWLRSEGISRDMELYNKLLEAVEMEEQNTKKKIPFPRYKDCKNNVITPPFTSFAKVYLDKNEYSIMATHGAATGGRTLGSRLNALDHYTKNVQDVDVLMMGHVHQKSFAETSVCSPGPLKTVWRNQMFVTTPGYLLYEGTYAERKGLRPGSFGAPFLILSHGPYKKITYVSSIVTGGI